MPRVNRSVASPVLEANDRVVEAAVNDGSGAVDANAPARRPGRVSPNYSAVQDLLISKAFIHASTDLVNGKSQRGATFKGKIAESYNLVVAEQLRLDKEGYESTARVVKSVNYDLCIDEPPVEVQDPVASPYPARTGDALHRRFSVTISPAVSKFLGLERQNPKKSGESFDQWFARIAIMYKKRFEHDFIWRLCKEYLQNKPKFSQYMEDQDGKEKANKRPTGKKQQVALESDSAAIQAFSAKATEQILGVASGSNKENEEAKGAFYNSIGRLADMGSDYMFMQVADEATKAAMARSAGEKRVLRMEIELLELKKQKLQLMEETEASAAGTGQLFSTENMDDTDSDLSE
jgi:hypothetical protein